ncbi:Uncharacterised protein [Mycobacteroides abscessus subsp. abscessus]|nr:Uncharacterised protein [Mycobacteroides abscessus subsp. abscessus]SKV43454.1 Uncharacterised protein [Mycobacteroides abscessus subsp. abscessus]
MTAARCSAGSRSSAFWMTIEVSTLVEGSSRV